MIPGIRPVGRASGGISKPGTDMVNSGTAVRTAEMRGVNSPSGTMLSTAGTESGIGNRGVNGTGKIPGKPPSTVSRPPSPPMPASDA